MTEDQIRLVVGSLLHDIGKIVYRSGSGKNHSQSGYEYLKEEAGIQDEKILDCVHFHHGKSLKGSKISDNSLAYITYYADNIAAAVDRRESMDTEEGFDREVPLASIFNILNGNTGTAHFARQVLDVRTNISYPTNEPVLMDEGFYKSVIHNITDNLRGISITAEYLNSLLAILEANLSYIPSSTSKRELADVSLFDHVKITAAVAQCLEQYLSEKRVYNYRDKLLIHGQESYKEKMFLLYSMDISGIQNFIYTIGSQGALRGLRARSFYLEILMEHVIDELLNDLSLSRANLIYSGGGHCYMLLPNTARTREIIASNQENVNQWFLDTFGIALYIAGGYVECSANELKNEPSGSYSQLYRSISKMISEKKAHRYTADTIRKLNQKEQKDSRECSICRRLDNVNEEGKCSICSALEKISGAVLYQDFFTVIKGMQEGALPLPNGKSLLSDTKESLIVRMKSDSYVRSYGKNDMYTGKHVAAKLWVGDYTTGDTFEKLAEKAAGIKRIGILRADVDNLGTNFVHGFQRPNGDERYVTLSRTAALSRQLSLFFKCHINHILAQSQERRLGGGEKRNVAIVYSGGDDVFLVGAWNEVIECFMDLRQAFSQFTQGTLTISGGIGLYYPSYPINIMAKEVAFLEELSKGENGKNAITLFDDTGTYSWDIFLERVMEEKFQIIQEFFDGSDERGKAFLYNLLELLRDSKERIQTARCVYLLSRMEPDMDSGKEQREAYKKFSKKMYEWIRDPQERREAVSAIYLYVYMSRTKEEE